MQPNKEVNIKKKKKKKRIMAPAGVQAKRSTNMGDWDMLQTNRTLLRVGS